MRREDAERHLADRRDMGARRDAGITDYWDTERALLPYETKDDGTCLNGCY
jgi:hypothetical protein